MQHRMMDVIIVNYKSTHQLRRCLESFVGDTTRTPVRVIVYDNTANNGGAIANLVNRYLTPQVPTVTISNTTAVSDTAQTAEQAVFGFFYADWCPTCKKMQPLVEQPHGARHPRERRVFGDHAAVGGSDLDAVALLLELVAGAVVFSVLTGLLSSLVPAVFASRLEPYEAVRKGE